MAPRRRKRRIRVGAIGENALVKMVKNILTLTPPLSPNALTTAARALARSALSGRARAAAAYS